ncbi:carbon storage regulator CsrA [Cohnella sp. GbtcB17]|uniref:carbon storage regulator CsrA n=1 Tax=Cohnella sp. GbtcB17 TaxID=2824762 RepID=UPI001C2F32C5|nr:carbon storage regulator CsrA [Cohnella sp. GbtcB17]
MLVLSRKKGQSILIGDGIEIVVVAVEGDQVKIGINAPPQIKVYRQEILEAIRESNKDAVASPGALQKLKNLNAASLDKFRNPES